MSTATNLVEVEIFEPKPVKEYVLGFLFNFIGSAVVLIEHQKFEKLNGVGGHREHGETPEEAMEREFLEETGTLVARSNWRQIGVMEGPDYRIVCFAARAPFEGLRVQTQKEGLVRWYWLNELWSGYPLMENLSWLIPIAKDPSVAEFRVRNF